MEEVKSVDGILNINKPKEFTSHDCVAIIRRLVGQKRVGHTGTLDPMATGVLPICIGKATRIIQYMDQDKKEYRCTMKLGVETDTCDIWGKIIREESTSDITEAQIAKAFKSLEGEIEQIPPMYAAIKVKGKKLYEYARAGKSVEIAPRKVRLFEITIEEIKLPEISFRVLCSRGTYVRSICRDIGQLLNCCGTMTQLERSKSGEFTIDKAIDLVELRKMDREDIRTLILPMDYPLNTMESIYINKTEARKFIDGKPLEYKDIEEKIYKIYCNDIFLATAKYDKAQEKLVAHKVLHTDKEQL